MTKRFLHHIVFCSLLALGACAVDEGGITTPEPGAETTLAQSVAVTSGVWVLDSTESCADLFQRSCTATFPSPQCPAGSVAGQPCSMIGAWCYKTITAGWFRAYQCQ